MSLGWCKDDQELEVLKETANKLMIKLNNDKKPTLPGMQEIVYGKEPDRKRPQTKKKSHQEKDKIQYSQQKL